MSLFGGDSAQPSLSPLPSSTPSLHDPAASQNAQQPPAPSLALDSNSDEDYVSDNDSEEVDFHSETSRPNKFKKHPVLWQRYTAADRQIAASLEDIESADLAAHLYNTHRLKRRVRRSAEKLAGIKDWHSKDRWLKKGEELQFTDPFGDTEAELIPSKQWTAWPLPPNEIPRKEESMQEADDEEDTWYIGPAGAQDAGENMREEVLALLLREAKDQWLSRESDQEEEDEVRRHRPKSQAKSEATNVKVDRSQSVAALDAEREDEEKQGGPPDANTRSEEKKTNRRYHIRPAEGPLSKPTFLADDDEARRILKPSVNSILTQLDGLALAIRRSRLNHFGRRMYSNQSKSEFATDAESVASRPRSSSYVGKKLHSRPTSRPTRKYRRGSSASGTFELPRRVGLMDWSEVLGIASMTGWNKRAVARTAQRCAALFDEHISFRAFDESVATEPVPALVQYTPSTILSPDALESDVPPKRPFFDQGTLRCPHNDCWGSHKDFAIPYRVVEHVMRHHKYDPRTNTAENEERKFGAVHVDGYLQLVTSKQGWLGRGRSRS
ncbi:hypothetical protein CC80DRAFT_382646, partial [Byssothecium circinans]